MKTGLLAGRLGSLQATSDCQGRWRQIIPQPEGLLRLRGAADFGGNRTGGVK